MGKRDKQRAVTYSTVMDSLNLKVSLPGRVNDVSRYK